MRWTLPVNLEVGGKEYAINADYRDILNIISRLNGGENEFVKVYVCLALFYPQFEEMPESDYQEAIEKLLWFIACGEEQEDKKRPKLIDWEQDYQMIAADIIKVAGHDVSQIGLFLSLVDLCFLLYGHWGRAAFRRCFHP